ncbi:MAG: hypothetical protein UHY68_00065 [Acutalibacteraceae bacterium]|nr:hypothetical protein [Acutalibacteraceae bacterium]
MKKSGKVWVAVVIALFIIIGFILGAGVYIYKLATDMSEASKVETTASTTIYEPLVKSIILGEGQTITDDDINGIIKKIMDEAPVANTNTKNTVLVNGVALYLQGEQTAKIYADIKFNDIRMIFSADATLALNSEKKIIDIKINNTKLGNLEIPAEWIMAKISPSIENISDSIDVNSTSVIVPSEYSFIFNEKEVELHIEKLDISQGMATVQTNSAMDLITEFIDDMVSNWFASM